MALAQAFKRHARVFAMPIKPCIRTYPWEYHCLTTVVTSWRHLAVWDPFSGEGGTATVFKGRAAQVLMSDAEPSRACDFVGDALSPKTFARAASMMKRPFAIVTSPWFSMLDMFIPVAVASTAELACVQVPTAYFTDGPIPRMEYISRLAAAGRVVMVASKNARNPHTGRRAMWLVIARNSAVLNEHVNPRASGGGWLTMYGM